jgi:chemosensory pili system protein ChpA (sensor histidine kinase/response regulator)
MSEAVSQTLVWVNEELATTLQEARQALEDFIERPENSNSLARCADRLHQAHGALKLTEVEGGALLADEMEQVALCLLKDPTDARRRSEGLDALTRSMVQLPAYMERVISGGADIPLVLLPLLNDLRAARGQPLLSENTLVLLNLPADRAFAGTRKRARPESRESMRQLARSQRIRYQTALLGWIRGQNPDSSLAAMADVMDALEQASSEDRSYQLWWVSSGVIEALRQGGLESSASVKRLLGQVDLQIRRLIDEGERALEADPPFELINSLLFYVARTTSRGRRVSEIRKAFSLADLIPQQQELTEARDSLSAPSIKLMQTVGAAIREDLTRVKDVLDIFVRTGMNRVQELSGQLDLLKKIGDTLGVLGVPALKDAVQAQERLLRDIAEGRVDPDEETLLGIAAILIEVESNLDGQLVSLVVDEEAAAGDAEDLAEIEAHRDFEAVTTAVLRECIANLERVKDAIVQALEAPLEPRVLDEVPYLLKGITAGLLLLDRTRAVSAVERIGSQIRRWLSIGDAVPSMEALERLADAIASVEYYMETIQGGRSDPMYMLDNAETCLAALDAIPREPILPPTAVAAGGAETVNLESLARAGADGDLEGAAADDRTRIMPRPPLAPEAPRPGTPSQTPREAPPPMPAPRVGPEAGQIDPELLELFIEEAGELAETLSTRFPEWESERDAEALAEVRRQFHTLKGSGRMVGAELIGEFAWSIENLLNRIIAGTVECSDAMVSFIGRSIEVVPSLVEQLESGAQPDIDVQAFIDQANAFAESKPDAEEMLVRTLAGRMPEVAEPEAGEMDPVLRDIFTKEASEHLKVLQAYVASRQGEAPPHEVTEELHRACHTLSGSANMAGVAPAVAIAAPLNQLLRRLHEDRAGLGDSVLDLCDRASRELEVIIDQVRQGQMPSGQAEDLVEAIQQEYAEHAMKAEAEEEETLIEAGPSVREEVRLDPEIAAIFCDEASELLDSADSALVQWREARGRNDLLDELQRHLHTLKGGARLAGVLVMGDLSHRLESVVSGLAEGRVEGTDDVVGLLQACLDELHGMREIVESGRLPEMAEALESRLEAVLAGAPAEVPEEEGVPEAEPAAPEAPALELPEEEAVIAAAQAEEAVPEQEVATEEVVEEAVAGPEAGVERRPALPAAFIPPPAASALLRAVPWPPTPPAEVTEISAEPIEEIPVERREILPPPAAAAQWRAVPWPPVGPPAIEAEPMEVAAEAPADVEWPAAGFEAPAEAPPELEARVPVPEAAPMEPESVEEAPELPLEAEQVRASHPGISRPEIARVDADLLESLLNNAGEVSIFRSRLEQQVGSIEFNLEELSQTVVRLRDQLRKLEMETEAQILHRHHDHILRRDDFDPLEMDQYSMIQQLSRALAETSSDVASLQQLLGELTRDAETLLTQQSRVISELQDGLMRTRMVPFSRHAQRLNRIVRQAARDAGKEAELHIKGGTSEIDRQVMEKVIPAFEHMLRNAVIHGIETPEVRASRDKPAAGRIDIGLRREGAEIIIEVADDGSGLDLGAIRRRAELQNLLQPGQPLSEDAAAELILKPGFSTATELTQAAGRGVGMDVVATAIRDLGGSLQVLTRQGTGTRFMIRLPYTRAITQALLVRCGEETFALPLPTVEGVVRLPAAEISRHLGDDAEPYRYGDREYRFRHLAMLVNGQAQAIPDNDVNVPIILVRAGDRSTALLTDELLGSREIVVKTLGPQLTGITGISGATILGDGSIVVILDAPALIRAWPEEAVTAPPTPEVEAKDHRTFVMVVDDSITVRRVTERLLERNGMRVMTAKDGVDAVAQLQDHLPDIMLLDIEMPRMDGYEVATHVRNDPRLKNIPIVMITSRVGQKHRTRAMEAGVDDYLGKPYQESELLAAIEALTGNGSARSRDE